MEIPNLLKRIGKINYFRFEMPQQSSVFYRNFMKKWRMKDKNNIPNLYLDLASHLISFIIYFFKKLPVKVLSHDNLDKSKQFFVNNNSLLEFKNFHGNIWFTKNAAGRRNDLKLEIYGEFGSLHWCHKSPELIKIYDNRGSMHIVDRLNTKTKYFRNNNFYTYSAGHPSGFVETFINTYNIFYEKIKNKKKDFNILGLKDNLNIITILNSMYVSSRKKTWIKVNYKND